MVLKYYYLQTQIFPLIEEKAGFGTFTIKNILFVFAFAFLGLAVFKFGLNMRLFCPDNLTKNRCWKCPEVGPIILKDIFMDLVVVVVCHRCWEQAGPLTRKSTTTVFQHIIRTRQNLARGLVDTLQTKFRGCADRTDSNAKRGLGKLAPR